jgi:hypothetical protein
VNNRMAWTFTITSIALFMVTLDNLVITTAIPVIRTHLHAWLASLEWPSRHSRWVNAAHRVGSCDAPGSSPHGRGRSLIPAASRSTTSAMRAARRSGRRVVESIQRKYALR